MRRWVLVALLVATWRAATSVCARAMTAPYRGVPPETTLMTALILAPFVVGPAGLVAAGRRFGSVLAAALGLAAMALLLFFDAVLVFVATMDPGLTLGEHASRNASETAMLVLLNVLSVAVVVSAAYVAARWPVTTADMSDPPVGPSWPGDTR